MSIFINSNICLRSRQMCKFIKCNFSQNEFLRNKNAEREARVFNKLMGNRTLRKKKFYVESDIGSRPTLPSLTAVGNSKGGKENSRRIHVLNKLFMKNITDMMVTGQHAADILGHGIEVSRVAVAPDFNKVNVFWLAGDKEDDSVIEKLLFDISFSLRHDLSQLRVMGVVPRIEFVKDKHYERVVKVERLLKTIDFGEDYVPVPSISPFNSETTFDVNTTTEIENKIHELELLEVNEKQELEEKEEAEVTEILEEPPLPPMINNTFNLDHMYIMNKIKGAKEKSKALHRMDPNVTISPSVPLSIDKEIMSEKERREGFAKFLLQRKILREKALKNEKKYTPEIEIHTQEVEKELKQEYLDYNEPFEEYDDYIEDEICDRNER